MLNLSTLYNYAAQRDCRNAALFQRIRRVCRSKMPSSALLLISPSSGSKQMAKASLRPFAHEYRVQAPALPSTKRLLTDIKAMPRIRQCIGRKHFDTLRYASRLRTYLRNWVGHSTRSLLWDKVERSIDKHTAYIDPVYKYVESETAQ